MRTRLCPVESRLSWRLRGGESAVEITVLELGRPRVARSMVSILWLMDAIAFSRAAWKNSAEKAGVVGWSVVTKMVWPGGGDAGVFSFCRLLSAASCCFLAACAWRPSSSVHCSDDQPLSRAHGSSLWHGRWMMHVRCISAGDRKCPHEEHCRGLGFTWSFSVSESESMV